MRYFRSTLAADQLPLLGHGEASVIFDRACPTDPPITLKRQLLSLACWVLKSGMPWRKMIQPLFAENWSCWIAMPVFSLSKSLSTRSLETGVSGHFEIANPGCRVSVAHASDRDAALPI